MVNVEENELNRKLVEEEEEEECLDWGSDDGDDAPAESTNDVEKAGVSPSKDGTAPAEGNGDLCVAVCTLCAAIPALVGSWCWPILVGAIFAVAAGQVNGGLVKFFHGVQVAIMLALMLNIVQFAYWNVQKKRKKGPDGKKASHWHMYKPVYLLLLATIQVLVQPTGMLVIGSWICDGAFTSDQLALGTTVVQNETTGLFIQADAGIPLPGDPVAGAYAPNGTFVCAPALDETACTALVSIVTGVFYSDGCDPDMKNFFFDGVADPSALTPTTTVGWCIQIFGTYLGFLFMFIGVCQATMLHKKIASKWADIRRAAA